ncbi:MAG: SPL family radical SAM protein [Lachnospiraceae bacterium]
MDLVQKGFFMLYLSFAQYNEASPFIQSLNLKAEKHQSGYQVFSSEEIKLIITGSGNIPAAICLAAFFQHEAISKYDIFLNIGPAYSSNNTDFVQFYSGRTPLFICNKIIELSTGRSFYPDLLFSHDFCETVCITAPVLPCGKTAFADILFPEEATLPVILDTEAASCYQAVIKHFSTDRIIFIKHIQSSLSDAQNALSDTRTVNRLIDFIIRLISERKGASSETFSYIRIREAVNSLTDALSLSVTMQNELFRLLQYYECAGKSSLSLCSVFLSEHKDLLPLNKKQGMLYYEEIKKEIYDTEPNLSESIHDNNKTDSGFSRIYIETQALEYPLTKQILSRFENLPKVYIKHYKDIFNRKNQNFTAQKKHPSLILSVNNAQRIYPGARTCQDFGHEYFYYTSQIKNCIYDCEYCYLQGMYPSAHINIFVNTEDYFADIDRLLSEHPVSLSISYDTDMTALNGITGLVKAWCEFTAGRKDLTVEIRTKCGSTNIFKQMKPPENVVFAYTLSPEPIAKTFEHGASGYEARKEALYTALAAGYNTRVSIDPVLPVKNFEEIYTQMIEDFFENPLTRKITDVSIGSFRISREFIKQMQSVRLSTLTTYPYSIREGICTFDDEKHQYMMDTLKKHLCKYIDESKLFISL